MHTNIKGPSGIARKCLLWLMIFILLSTTQAFASEPISYRNVQLTTEPARDKLSIRLTPQILGSGASTTTRLTMPFKRNCGFC